MPLHTGIYVFEDFRLDFGEKTLFRRGTIVPITPKVFDLLELFIKDAGRLVEKDELMRRIWPDRFVEESNITFNIKMLRRALGDNAHQPRFIETVQSRGYRFIADVRRVGANGGNNGSAIHSDVFAGLTDEIGKAAPPARAKASRRTVHRPIVIAAGGALAVCIIALAYFGNSYLRSKKLITSAFKNTKVEKLPILGKLHSVAISPDERYLAYVKGETLGKMHLMLRQQATGSEMEIHATENSMMLLDGFSSDGNYFYFRTINSGFGSFYRVPILGGEPKLLVDNIDSNGSFCPNGKDLVFVRRVREPIEGDTFVMFNVESGESREIYAIDGTHFYDPKVSPDGETITFFFLQEHDLVYQLACIPITGGQAATIGNGRWTPDGLDSQWLSDGSGLVVSGRDPANDNSKLSLVDFPSGRMHDLTRDVNSYKRFALSSNDQTIAAIQSSTAKGIWEFDVGARATKQIRENTIGPETRGLGPGVIPDGQIIYSKPDGKGNTEIWSTNSDGTGDRLFLSLSKPIRLDYNPVWGDGIYFHVAQKLWKVDFDGKNSRQLFKDADSFEYLVGVTPDCKTLVYRQAARDSESLTLNRLNLETGETSLLIEDKDLNIKNAAMSADGRKIIYEYKPNDSSAKDIKNILVLVDFDGSKISNLKVIPEYPLYGAMKFSPDAESVYFVKLANRADIWEMNLHSGEIAKVTDFNLETIFNFNFSPDGKDIYLTRGNTTDEVVLIKSVE